MKTFLHFRPEYVREFVCDGSKCNANCCERNWNIDIDAETYERYEKLQPASKSRAITSCFVYNPCDKIYFLKEHPCPFLTDEKLCRLQLEYGENFLSKTCVTFPRQTFDFGKFFERSLSLSCPVAAEMILFRDEPLKFELVEVSEPEHSRGGKLKLDPVDTNENFVDKMLELQVAMISILQERTLSFDQRLIVLGFFMDRLREITAAGFRADEVAKLVAAYESKAFLSQHVPRMFASVNFNVKFFVELMLLLLEKLQYFLINAAGQKFMDATVKTFDIYPDANRQISVDKVVAAYEKLADARKDFLTRHATFIENFLVNEIFANGCPWKFPVGIAKNFGLFVAQYKQFELLMFSATRQNLGDKDNLLALTSWFVGASDNNKNFAQVVLSCVPDDIFTSLEMLTDAQSILVDTKKAVL